MLPSLTEIQAERKHRKAKPRYDFDQLTLDERSELGALLQLASGQRGTVGGVRRLSDAEIAQTRAYLAVSQIKLLSEADQDTLRRRAGLVAIGTPEALEQSRTPAIEIDLKVES